MFHNDGLSGGVGILCAAISPEASQRRRAALPRVKRAAGAVAERLESRCLLSTAALPAGDDIPFQQIVIDKNPGTVPVVKVLGDLTNNGKLDAIIGHESTLGGGGLFWYQFPSSGNPSDTWTKHTIDATADCYEQGAVADISGHVDSQGNPVMDIVMCERGTVVWYENPLGDGIDPTTVSSWTKHVIGTVSQGVTPTHEMFLADLDGDGKLDVVTNNAIFFQNSPTSWTEVANPTYNRTQKGLYLFNSGSGLGAVDLLGTGEGPGFQVGWYENPRDTGGNARTNAWVFHPVGPTYTNFTSGGGISYGAMDVNGDGHEDIITCDGETPNSSPEGGLIWWQSPADPATGTWIEHAIDPSLDDVHNIVIADMNGDGTPDILAFEQDQSVLGRLMIVYNEGGTGQNWLEQNIASDADPAAGGGEGGQNEKVGDITGDGNLDILTAPHGYYTQVNPISVYMNQLNADGIVRPTITSSPASQSVNPGGSVTFSVSAAGTGPLTYQWELNGLDIPGANSSTYTVDSVGPSDNSDVFRCIVGNPAGLIPSAGATVSVVSEALGSISGSLFNDQNANGVQDSNDGPLTGWTVFLDLNSDGTPDPGDPTATTDSNGNFTFNNVAAGTYQLGIVEPLGWQITTNGGSLPTATVAEGQNTSLNPIGSTFAAISGNVFLDTDGNGVQDPGEGPAVGQELFVDLNNDGTLDPGDPTATTDSSGNYEFTGLSPGAYTVEMVIPRNSHESYPVPGGGQAVTVSDNPATSINFGIAPGAIIGGITGTLVVDPAGGGQVDNDERSFPPRGQTIYLDLQNTGSYQSGDPSTTIDARGDYSFTNLADGTYTVRFLPAKNYVQNYPINNAGQTVTVAGHTVENVILGEVKGTPTVNGNPFAVEISSNLPATAVGGEKEKATLRVTNSEGIAYHGPVVVDLFLGTNNTIDGDAVSVAAPVIKHGLPRKGQSIFNIRYTVPDALQADSYYLLGSVTAGAAGAAIPATTASNGTITVSPPLLSFSATVRDQSPVLLTPDMQSIADVEVTNTGNIPASGDITINLYASASGTLDASSILLDSPTKRFHAAPLHSHNYRIAFTPPPDLAIGDYVLLAQASSSAT